MPDVNLEGLDGFRTQVAIWGYALQGHGIIETAALVAEGHPALVRGMGAWDKTARDLAGQFITHGDTGPRRVRDWAALPWITEHALRGHVEWPGL